MSVQIIITIAFIAVFAACAPAGYEAVIVDQGAYSSRASTEQVQGENADAETAPNSQNPGSQGSGEAEGEGPDSLSTKKDGAPKDGADGDKTDKKSEASIPIHPGKGEGKSDKEKENGKGIGIGKGLGSVKNPQEHDADALQCARILSKDVKKIKVAGRGKVLDLKSDEALALKVTGTSQNIKLTLKNLGSGEIDGLCLFVAGNKNSVQIDVGSKLGTIAVKARGNQARILLTVEEPGAVAVWNLNLNGNKPQIVIEGGGTYTCPEVVKKGSSLFSCKSKP